MAETTEALEFIDSTRTKACTLYATDKIALPIVKAVDLLERMVKGDADEVTLVGDVRRLLDEVDYTRQRDEKRDDPLRSVISDVCKLIGLAARAIGVKKEEEPSRTESTCGSTDGAAVKGSFEKEAMEAQPGPSNPHQAHAIVNVAPVVAVNVRPQQEQRIPPTLPTPTPAQLSRSSHWNGASTAGYPNQHVKEESQWEEPVEMEGLPKEEVLDLTGNEASCSSWPHDGDDNSSHSSLPVLSYLKRPRDLEQRVHQPVKRVRKGRRTSANNKRYDDDGEEKEERARDSDYDEEPDYAPAGMERARIDARNEDPGEDGMYHCRLCTKKFAKLHGLRTHGYTHELTLPCTICHQLVKKDNMARHMCLVHNGPDTAETSKEPPMPLLSVPCPICGQMCADEPHLNRHMRTHSGDSPFPCPHCDSSMRSASLRNRHIRMIHLVQPWQCATCRVQYAREKELKDHLMINRGHISLLQD